MSKENMTGNPMYGMISFARAHCSGSANLFGSAVPCDTVINITLKKGVVERSLSTEWFYGRDMLFEVTLSPAQFAEAITNMNCGDGVPCTIRYNGAEKQYHNLNECPYEPQFTMYEHEFNETCRSANDNVNKLIADARTLLDQKNIKKSDVKALIDILSKVSKELNDSLPFVQSSFNEYLNKSVDEAKQEVEAFIQHRLTSLGIESAKQFVGVDIQPKQLATEDPDEYRTYEFRYTNLTDNSTNTVQFCTHSEQAAYQQFREFLKYEEHLNYDTDITDVTFEETYNTDDAEKYGEVYMSLPF